MFDPIPAELTKVIEETQQLEGWCPPEKANDMVALILREQPGLVVEIGVFGGRSFLPQATALRWKQWGSIYGIDPFAKDPVFEGSNHGADTWTDHDFNKTWDILNGYIITRQLEEYIHLIREHSHRAARLFQPNTIDILHIDGNHSTEVSTRDVELYLPLVKPGGYVWLDDTYWDSVQPAIRMVEAACEVVKDYTHYRLYRKPE